MNDAERFEALEEILDILQEMSATHIALIEGNKDRRALDNLGLCDLQTIEVHKSLTSDFSPFSAQVILLISSVPRISLLYEFTIGFAIAQRALACFKIPPIK